MNGNEILLNSDELNDLAEELKKLAIDDIYQDIEVDWKIVQSQAKTFITNYERLEKIKKTRQLKKIHQLINPEEGNNYVSYLTKADSDEDNYTRAQYLLAFQFDDAINKFLKKLPKKAAFVYSTGKTVETYEMSMRELALRADKHGRFMGNISKKALRSEQKEQKRKSVEDTKKEIEHVAIVRAAYFGTVNRLNRYYEKRAGFIKQSTTLTQKEKDNIQRNRGILMWKIGRYWTLARILNEGDVREAYVSALMIEHQSKLDALCNYNSKNSIGKEKYYSHNLIKTFFNNYISKVTNQSAIVEEDVITGTSQIAVKSKSAGLPSMNQYLKTAEWVLKQKNVMTSSELKAYIDDEWSKNAPRNKVVKLKDLKDYEQLTINNTKQTYTRKLTF